MVFIDSEMRRRLSGGRESTPLKVSFGDSAGQRAARSAASSAAYDYEASLTPTQRQEILERALAGDHAGLYEAIARHAPHVEYDVWADYIVGERRGPFVLSLGDDEYLTMEVARSERSLYYEGSSVEEYYGDRYRAIGEPSRTCVTLRRLDVRVHGVFADFQGVSPPFSVTYFPLFQVDLDALVFSRGGSVEDTSTGKVLPFSSPVLVFWAPRGKRGSSYSHFEGEEPVEESFALVNDVADGIVKRFGGVNTSLTSGAFSMRRITEDPPLVAPENSYPLYPNDESYPPLDALRTNVYSETSPGAVVWGRARQLLPSMSIGVGNFPDYDDDSKTAFVEGSQIVDFSPGGHAAWEPGGQEGSGFPGTDLSYYSASVPVQHHDTGLLPAFEITSATTSDGEPPETEPRPAPVPVGGGCWSSVGGPSGCNFVTPLPPGPLPLPGDDMQFEPPGMPDMPPIDMPIEDISMPEMPPIDCQLPDFGNFDACPPFPGTGGPMPGGFSPDGKPIPGVADIRTRGPGNRKETFEARRCYTNKPVTDAIRELAREMGLSEDQLMFEATCTKRFTKCFPKGSSKFDAIWWLADLCGFAPIDDGDGTIVIGEVKPLPTTWTFHEDVDLFTLERNYSGMDVHHAVEVFRLGKNPLSIISYVNGPFRVSEDDVLRIEVAPETPRGEMESLASREAAKSRQSSLSVKCAVPYDYRRKLRHQIVIRRPSRGFEERFMVTALESDFSDEGHLHIVTASLI